jgi:hypothetical protein
MGVMGYYKIKKMRKMECPRLCWPHEMSIRAFGGGCVWGRGEWAIKSSEIYCNTSVRTYN